jgi:hypothetical protein
MTPLVLSILVLAASEDPPTPTTPAEAPAATPTGDQPPATATPPTEVPPPPPPLTEQQKTADKEAKKEAKKEAAKEAVKELNEEYPGIAEEFKLMNGVKFKPGKGVEIKEDDFKLKVELYVQPLVRGAFDTIAPTQGEVILRRVRFATEGKAPGGFKAKIDIQIKNNNVGLGGMYGGWEPSKEFAIEAGYLKPPGGIERDTHSFDMPFEERSVVAFLTYDKELGARIKGDVLEDTWHYALAVTRPAPVGIDGGDPEDATQPADPEDAAGVLNSPYRWDVSAGGAWSPSEHGEVGLNGGVRVRPDGDFGDRLAEPYDTSITLAHPYKGLGFHVGGDAALSLPYFKASFDGGYRRDGTATDDGAVGNLDAWLGYLVFGFTPFGHYGPAIDNAPLLDSWEIVARVEGARLTPAQNDGKATNWAGATLGWHWEVSPECRLQTDVGYEYFDANSFQPKAQRVFTQVWATFRL